MKSQTTAVVLFLAMGLCLGVKSCLEARVHPHSKKTLTLPVVDAVSYGRSLKRYSLGFGDLIADLLWIDLLQYASHEKLTEGKVSWEYAQLEAITTLCPNFLRAYDFGAAYLSVFRRDKEGAKRILEKWVNRQPTYWKSHYTLGYHLFFEMNDSRNAYPEILTAASLPGAPSWLGNLGVRVLSESGALFTALKLSLEMYDTLKVEDDRRHLRSEVRALHYHIQKNNLQKALAAYRLKTHRAPSNLGDLAPYIPMETRQLASQIEAERIPEDLQSILAEKFPFAYSPKSKEIICLKSEKELGLEQPGIYWNDDRKGKQL